MGVTRFVPSEVFSAVATVAQASVNCVVFNVPYAPVGMIAQVLAPTTGAINVTGLTVLYANGKVTVAVNTLAAGSIVSLICF